MDYTLTWKAYVYTCAGSSTLLGFAEDDDVSSKLTRTSELYRDYQLQCNLRTNAIANNIADNFKTWRGLLRLGYTLYPMLALDLVCSLG